MTPVLPPVQVVGDVEVLVPVLQGVMLMMALRPRHRAHPLFGPTLAEEPTLHRAMEPDKRIPHGCMGTTPPSLLSMWSLRTWLGPKACPSAERIDEAVRRGRRAGDR
jgi:hypothetical protein